MTYIHITQEQPSLSMSSSSSKCDDMKNVKNNNDMKKNEMMTKIGLQWYNHIAQPNKNCMKEKILSSNDYNHDIYALLLTWVSSGIIDRNEYDRLLMDDNNTIQQMKYTIIDILPWNTPYNDRINMRIILLNSIGTSRNNSRRNLSIHNDDDIVKPVNNDRLVLLEEEEQTESSSSSDDNEDDDCRSLQSSSSSSCSSSSPLCRLSSLRSSLSLINYSNRRNDTADIISNLNLEENNNSDNNRQMIISNIKLKKNVRFLDIDDYCYFETIE